MVLGIDIDGVLCDLHAPWLRMYNEEYDDTLSKSAITAWDLSKFVKPECGKRIFDYLDRADALYDAAPPIAGALGAVERIRKEGFQVYFVTSCDGYGSFDAKKDWLVHNGFCETPDEAHKYTIAAFSKAMVATDILIDDRDKNCQEFTLSRPGLRLSVLFPQPWNVPDPEGRRQWPLRAGWDTLDKLATLYPSLKREMQEELYAGRW